MAFPGDYEAGSAEDFRLQDYSLGLGTAIPGLAEPTHLDGLRASRLGASPAAKHLHHTPRAAAKAGLGARFVARENQRYLTAELVEEAAGIPGVSADRVRAMAPQWLRDFAPRVPDLAAELVGASPDAQLAAVNRAFLDDRLDFVGTHHYLARDQGDGRREDDPARYRVGEWGSIYWDMNRALSARGTAGGRDAGSGGGVTELRARDSRMPPLQLSDQPVFTNPSRFSGRGQPQDRDRALETWRALQERSDRRPTALRGRPLRYFDSDGLDFGGPFDGGANPKIGANFSRGMADRAAASAAATARARDARRVHGAQSERR